MSAPPSAFELLLGGFAPVFSSCVFRRALALAEGAVLAPGRRTVATALRALGRADAADFSG